uniref:Uncharacterized protein n=1 Tax=Cryptomonas curvata TaxID=233186 RepID=A0A7S0QMN3_9CRYP|mmetsp:Transcript_36761/g.76763  ORF Transcript_36761/g.76763 Transcript_36761/m.76763 type:complete len:404 (+) Transcript_36761:73-1284(+)
MSTEQQELPTFAPDSKEEIQKPSVKPSISKDSIWVRATCLLLLCCQNCIAILAIKYNSRLSSDDGLKSLSTIVIALVECIKVVVCLLYLLVVNRGFGGLFSELKAEIVDKPLETAKLLVPSLLYVVQNNLLFVAVSNLDPGAYQVTSQLKTLVTALFAILILGKKITFLEWVSLFLLVIGCSVVQFDAAGSRSGFEEENQMLGFISTVLASVLSGFCGIYIELLLKSSTPNLAVRNIQLGAPGFVLALLVAYMQDQNKIFENGAFQGFTWMTWTVVCLHALGGFLVAAVMLYADNISKCFAMALSLIVSSLASVPLFDSRLSIAFACGSTTVVAATMMYSKLPLPSPAAVFSWCSAAFAGRRSDPSAGDYQLVALEPTDQQTLQIPPQSSSSSEPFRSSHEQV